MKRFSILPLISNIIVVVGIVFLLASCDVIEPNERKQTGIIDTPSKAIKKVLIEDFTGFKCVNCPQAAESGAQLLDVYKDKVIIVAHHSGGFATPFGTKYIVDLRTPIGEELFPIFVPSQAQPNGVINRRKYNDAYEVTHTDWAAKAAAGLAEKAGMTIELKPTFDTVTRILSVKATIKYLESGTKDHQLAMYLIEDSIITYQKDIRLPSPGDIPNYVQKHVFRSDIGNTGAYGKQLSASAIAVGTTLEETFTLSFAGKIWKPEHCAVVGFVNNGTTKEVLQVEEAAVLGH